MTREQLEFTIAQYAAGDTGLTPDERAAAEQAIAHDPELRAVFEAEQRLSDAMRTLPTPDVNYGALLAKVSAAVASEPAHEGHAPRRGNNALIRLFRSPLRLAAAAAVVLAMGVAVPLVLHDRDTRSSTSVVQNPMTVPSIVIRQADADAAAPTPIIAVDPALAANMANQPNGSPAVAVGPPAGVRGDSDTRHFADAQRPTRVEISGDHPTTQGSSAASPF